MKKTQYITIFLFLFGMLFTVFQYLPLIEEEVPGHRTEMHKKAKENNTSDGNDCEDDDASGDDDVKAALFHALLSHYSFSRASKDHFYSKPPLYQSGIAKIHTPPPKV